MKKLLLLLALCPFALPAFAQEVKDDAPAPVAALSAQDQKDLGRVETYFNALKPLQANFTQSVQQYDGTASEVTGTFKLWRPGRLRIDYAKPSEDFIVADGSTLYQWDAQMKQQSQTGIESTLAGFLLRRELKFSGDDVTVLGVKHSDPTHMEITLRSAKEPQAGEMTLLLQDVPLQLKGWRVLDAQGLTTTVALTDVQEDVTFKREDFVFRNPLFGQNKKH